MNPGDTKLKPPGEPSGAAGRLLLESAFLFGVKTLQIEVLGAITKGGGLHRTPMEIFHDFRRIASACPKGCPKGFLARKRARKTKGGLHRYTPIQSKTPSPFWENQRI